MIPLDFAFGLGSGLIIAAALYLTLRWRAARNRAEGEWRPQGAVWPAIAHMEDPVGLDPDAIPPTSPTAAPLAAQTLPLSLTIDPEPRPPSGHGVARLPRASDDGPRFSRPAPPPETLRLSQRVILHVYAQGSLPPGEVAPLALCQAGLVEALGIPQAGLAAVLRRLEAAGVLVTERGHVRGRDRRLKIYRLSPRGIEVARELRTRSHRRTGR